MANLVSQLPKKLAFELKMVHTFSMKCFLLPGMGADERMYDAQWDRLGDVTRIHWPHDCQAISLTDLARQLIADYDIKADAVVIGSSLGGMVACEIAHLCQNQQIVLVGSATSRAEILALLQWLHPLIDHAPLSLLQWSAGSCPLELTRMFQASSPTFLRTMSKAVFAWNGYDISLPRPLRIHGKRDLVIPCPKNADCIIDGGHLIAMSHSKECVDFILTNLTQTI